MQSLTKTHRGAGAFQVVPTGSETDRSTRFKWSVWNLCSREELLINLCTMMEILQLTISDFVFLM